MEDVKKLVESITSQEIQRCVSSIGYNVTNKVLEFLKTKHERFVDVKNIEITHDDDGTVIVKIVLKKI